MPKGYIEYQDRIGSQHELTTPGNRKSDVVISAIEKCEKLEQEVKQLRQLLKECKSFLEYAHPVEDISVFEGIEDILTKIEECL